MFFLALQPISRKTEGRINLRYVQVVYRSVYVNFVHIHFLVNNLNKNSSFKIEILY